MVLVSSPLSFLNAVRRISFSRAHMEENKYSEEALLASFHSSITSNGEAARRLKGKPAGTFLWYKAPKPKDTYVLSANVIRKLSNRKKGATDKIVVVHRVFKLKMFAMVEGFYFDDFPARVCPTIYELLGNSASTYVHPLPAPVLALQIFDKKEDQAEAASNEENPEYSSMEFGDLQFSLELFLHIFRYLSVGTLGAVACTCKRFYLLSKDEFVWQCKYLERFGEWVPPSYHEKGEIDWKIKYWFEHSLVSSPTEPFVYGMPLVEQPRSNVLMYSQTSNDVLVLLWKYDYCWEKNWGVPKSCSKTVIYRVKAPVAGYAFEKRPKEHDVSPTLHALLQAYCDTRKTYYTSVFTFPFPERIFERGLRDMVIYGSSVKSLHVKSDGPLEREFCRTLLENNKYVEEIVFHCNPDTVVSILMEIPPERLGPLTKVRLCLNKGSMLPTWLARDACVIRTVAVNVSTFVADWSFLAKCSCVTDLELHFDLGEKVFLMAYNGPPLDSMEDKRVTFFLAEDQPTEGEEELLMRRANMSVVRY